RMRGRSISFCCANREEAIRNKSNSFLMSYCTLHLLASKSGGLVNGFDQRQAAPAFNAVAKWSAIGLNGADEVFDCVLVSADITHHRRRGARILITCIGANQRFMFVAEIGGDDAILLEDDCALSAGNLQPARIAWICCCCCQQGALRAARKFEHSKRSILAFDLVQDGSCAGLERDDVSEQPDQQINRVDALIHERSAAIESQRATPLRIAVILGRAIPPDARVNQQDLAESSGSQKFLQAADVRFEAIL